MEAARRKFSPEFMNRIDKIVTFQSALAQEQLRKNPRHRTGPGAAAHFQRPIDARLCSSLTQPAAKDFLLREGTDMKFGARHLKRAIERLLVQPISNRIATGQAREGDSIKVDWNRASDHLTFTREAEGLPFWAMTDSLGRAKFAPAFPTSRVFSFEAAKAQARFSRTT